MNGNSVIYTSHIWKYLIPDNPFALGIVLILIFVFSLWFGLIVYNTIWLLKKDSKQIKNCEDVGKLVEARQSSSTETEKSKLNEEVFGRFCNEKSICEQSPVAKHLKSIFLAGWTESRLEVNELLNHTTQQLFQWNNILRSILSTFIVIGLLGTLFGLATSLAHLSPVLGAGSSQQTNQGITQALSQLLTQMKSAFAPSIWGVSLTVLGVLIYGVYLRFVCSPVKTALEWLTLTVWVPQLYPTTSQKLIETLQKSEEQMGKNFDAAHRVADLAKSVENDMNSFSENLNQVSSVTSSVTTAVSQINKAAELINKKFAERLSKFSKEFSESVSSLTSLDELRTLYKQMVSESKTFQKVVRDTLSSQNTQLEDILKNLKIYEDAYIKERGQIDAKLKQFLDEATETNKSTNAKNRELVEQIREQLTIKLSEIENTLRTGLLSIIEKFGAFDVPIRTAAENIAGSQENFVKQMGSIIGDLQREFQKQNDNNKQQLDALAQLNQRIEDLLTQLSQNSKDQSGEVYQLNRNITSLTSNIASLGTTIQQFSEQVISQQVVKEPSEDKKSNWLSFLGKHHNE